MLTTNNVESNVVQKMNRIYNECVIEENVKRGYHVLHFYPAQINDMNSNDS